MFGLPGISLNYLLSFPLISYYLLPTTTTGWSTYLNLIFFSLAWTSLVWTQPPLAVEFLSLLGVRLFFYIIPSLLFLAFDLSVPTAARSLKARDSALPLEAAGKQGSARSQSERLARIVGLTIFNTVLGVALQTGIDFFFTDVLHLRSVLKISSRLPTPWALTLDVIKALMIRGTVGYYIHRFLLHDSKAFPRLTKMHSAYAHSLTNALPFSAAYDHPIPYLLQRWVPLFFPAFIFRFHVFTYMAFTALVSLEEALVYSGYQVLPSTVLLTGMARRQERHIISGGSGNFAPYGLLDFAHGTNVGEGDIMDDLRKEAGKRDVGGKAKGAMNAAKGAAGRIRDNDGDVNEADGEANTGAGRRRKK